MTFYFMNLVTFNIKLTTPGTQTLPCSYENINKACKAVDTMKEDIQNFSSFIFQQMTLHNIWKNKIKLLTD